MSVKSSLHEEILTEIEEIHKLEVGSDKHKVAVDSVAKLVDRAIEMEKLDIEISEKEKNRENEMNLKLAEIEEDRKDRFVKNCITVAGIAVPSLITIWGTLKSFEFEKEGTITTIMGRGFINKLLPKK